MAPARNREIYMEIVLPFARSHQTRLAAMAAQQDMTDKHDPPKALVRCAKFPSSTFLDLLRHTARCPSQRQSSRLHGKCENSINLSRFLHNDRLITVI